MAKSFCLKIIDVKFFEISTVNCLELKKGFEKGRDQFPALFASICFLANLGSLDIGTVIALMIGHA
jgi:hypothetical protein